MWYNPIMRGLLRSPLHSLLSKNMMLMTYTGRKSGKSFTTPMNYLAVGDELYTISSRERVWWRNLRGGAPVTLRLQGKEIPARSESIDDENEVAKSLYLYLKTAPQLAKYMGIKLDSQGAPDVGEVAGLAREKVIVRTSLK